MDATPSRKDPTLCDYYATWESEHCDPDPEVCVNCEEGETDDECAERFASEVEAKKKECPVDQDSSFTVRAPLRRFRELLDRSI